MVSLDWLITSPQIKRVNEQIKQQTRNEGFICNGERMCFSRHNRDIYIAETSNCLICFALDYFYRVETNEQ